MRISDWSSDVCSSDLLRRHPSCRGSRPHLQIESPAAAQLCEHAARLQRTGQIGRASCMESVCQYVKFSVVAVSLKHNILQQIVYLISCLHFSNLCYSYFYYNSIN